MAIRSLRLRLPGLALGLAGALLLAWPAHAQPATPDLLYYENYNCDLAFPPAFSPTRPVTPVAPAEIDVYGVGGLEQYLGFGNTISSITTANALPPDPAYCEGWAVPTVTNTYANFSGIEAGTLVNLYKPPAPPSPLTTGDSVKIRGAFKGLGQSPAGPYSYALGVFFAKLNGLGIHAGVRVYDDGSGQTAVFRTIEENYTVFGVFGQTPDIVLTSTQRADLFNCFEMELVVDRTDLGAQTAEGRLTLPGPDGSCGTGDDEVIVTGDLDLTHLGSQTLPYFGQYTVVDNWRDVPYFDWTSGGGQTDTMWVQFEEVEVWGTAPSADPPQDTDYDGAGPPGPPDNCPDIADSKQINSDTDTHGDACDNCPYDDNEDQADADNDGYGDVCDVEPTTPNEELDSPVVGPKRPGEPYPVRAIFKNPTGKTIQTIRPDCYNTFFEVYDPVGARRLNPLYRVKVYGIPKDVIKLKAGESHTIFCDLSEHYPPEELTSGAGGVSIFYDLTAHYGNDTVDKDCLPDPAPGVPGAFHPVPAECMETQEAYCSLDDGEPCDLSADPCPGLGKGACVPAKFFMGRVSSATKQVEIKGDPILAAEQVTGQCSLDPSTWDPAWAGPPGSGTITATIAGLPDPGSVDLGTIELEGGVLPSSTPVLDAGTGEITVTFHRGEAVAALGSLTGVDAVYPQIYGLYDVGPPPPPSGAELFRAKCAVEIGVLVIPVEIDVKPTSADNKITCNEDLGTPIPVAIYTTPAFDATTVDHTSVTFQGASEAHIHPVLGTPQRHEADVDLDGDADLLFHFLYGDTDLPPLCPSTVDAVLEGKTFEGVPVIGSDVVQLSRPPGGGGRRCGLGAELALLVPPLMWLHGRRRRSR